MDVITLAVVAHEKACSDRVQQALLPRHKITGYSVAMETSLRTAVASVIVIDLMY